MTLFRQIHRSSLSSALRATRRMATLAKEFPFFSSDFLRGGEGHPRVDSGTAEERRAKRGKDAGSANSSAERPRTPERGYEIAGDNERALAEAEEARPAFATEDAASRSSVASALLRARKRAALGCVTVAMGLLLTAAPSAEAAAPVVTTGAAAELHFSRALLGGTVNPSGQGLEECLFEYGEKTATYTQTAPCAEPGAAAVGSGTKPVAVHAQLTGLSASTEYHFRLTVKSADSTVHGADATFTTLGPPRLSVSVSPNAEWVQPGRQAAFRVIVENTGEDETLGPIKIKNTLPPALTASEVRFFYVDVPRLEEAEGAPHIGTQANLAGLLCSSTAECRFPGSLSGLGIQSLRPGPGERLVMLVGFQVPEGLEGPLADFGEVSGGGAPRAEASATLQAAAAPAFGHLGFGATLTNAAGEPYTQAGGHPYEFSTEFDFATVSCVSPESQSLPYDSACPLYDPKDITSYLPPGLIANPQAVPHCKLAAYFAEECERLKDAVGTLDLRLYDESSSAYKFIEPILNLEPSSRYPGELGALVAGAPYVLITSSIRDGSDYGVTSTSATVQSGVNRTRVNLWGVPANHAHDPLRGKVCEGFGAAGGKNPSGYNGIFFDYLSLPEIEEWCARQEPLQGGPGGPAETPEVPFLTMPTECSGDPLIVRGLYDSWQQPALYAEESSQLPPVEACNALSFEPTIESRPTTSLADAPSGLEFDLHVPQNEAPEGVATPELKESVVTLPRGIRLNPASANGRRGCTEAQANLHVEAPSECPDASKLGEAEIVSSLLHEPLKGSLFLATPHANPFGALLAVYLSVEGQGIRIKTPGHLETDPQTGQITTRFPQNPQLPFEDSRLRIFGGALGALRTPSACGVYTTTSEQTPFSAPESGPPAKSSAGFETTEAENGGPCPKAEAEEPNAPRFSAGTETPQAGAFSPFALKLVRDDGSQEMSRIETTLPPGLIGRLAGIAYCPQAGIERARSREREGGGAEEQADPSCPASSEVGTVDVTAGAGPTPIGVPGHAYLAGPYRGAPLSILIVTPALTGPFDLGAVVVRAGLYVNPETAQITAKSDPLPSILDGIPLDLRSVALKLSRHDFTLNPTDCNELGFTGAATSVLGQVAPLSERFQVGGCSALPFKPALSMAFSGSTKQAGNPAVHADLSFPSGGPFANVSRAVVTLPPTDLVDNAHINTPCTKVQFAEGIIPGERCPPGSVIGFAKATTSLLEKPLEGPVYLRAHPGVGLPDIVAALNGQIDIALVGKVDTVGGRIRTSFETVPDAPVSNFSLTLDGGHKGLLENKPHFCAHPLHAAADITAQNGKTANLNPLLRTPCAKRTKHRKRHHRGARR